MHEPGSEEPRQIGPYRILELLGEGGMGLVYAAEQRQPFHRRVALKVIKVGMDTRDVLARFEAERQALALLDHPNIAKVLDAGATAEGRPYFAMELVRGRSITQYADANKLSVGERIELVLQACAALHHAHERGILHRDVKPTNLLVAEIDGKPVVKVIDFGLAKATNQRLTERTLYTEEGRIIGTPEYMSPEQAGASQNDLDSRSDVFSLGVVLYELIAGALPFDFGSVRSKGYFEIQRFIREEEPPTLARRLSGLRELVEQITALRRCRLQDLTRSLRHGLDAVVMKAMAKQRRDRYESCAGFADDLRRFLAGEPVLARRVGAIVAMAARVRRFHRRHPAVLPVLAAALFVGVGTWWSMRGNGTSSSSTASMAREPSADASTAVRDDRTGKSGAEPRSGDALQQFEAALAMQQRLFAGRDHPDVATSLTNLASCLLDLGRAGDALPQFEAAFAMQKRLFAERDHPSVATSLTNLASCLLDLGRVVDALPQFEAALAMQKRLYAERDHPGIATSLTSLGDCLKGLGRTGEALSRYEAALAMAKRLHGDAADPRVASTLSGVATCLQALGRLDEALPHFRAELAMWRSLYGSRDHPHVARSLRDLGRCLQALGREAPTGLALLIGVAEPTAGDGPPFPVLRGPVNDVFRVQSVLRERFSFSPESIVTLSGSAATHEAIVRAFDAHLIRQAGPNTKVVIWFSGYGRLILDPTGADDSRRLEGASASDATFVASDSRATDKTGGFDFSDDELVSLLSAIPSTDVVCVMDCCHAGGFFPTHGRGRHPEAEPPRALLPFWPSGVRYLDDFQQGELPHVVMLAACDSVEEAGELLVTPAGTFGTFTWFLTQQLDTADGWTWEQVLARARVAMANTGTRLQTPTADGKLNRGVFEGLTKPR